MATLNPARPGTGYPPPSPVLEQGGTSLGEWLKRTREQQGLTLDRLVRETKIPLRHLEALEHDNLKAIPGGIYQRAEIRAVARSLGLDQDRALALLESALHPATPAEKTREIPFEPQPALPRRYLLALVVVIVAAAAPLWWSYLKPTPSVSNGGAAAPREATAPPLAVPDPPVDSGVVAPAAPASPTAPVVSGSPAIPGVSTAAESAVTTGSSAAVTQLVITTQPAGAHVTVNGIGWGTSPVTIRYLSPGDKVIRVSKEGYAAAERSLRLDEGQPQTIDIPLAGSR
jgi:cytoskeletal protein RodZ